MERFSFPDAPFSAEAEALRAEVRSFLSVELAAMPAQDRVRSWGGFDAGFSRKMGERGWIGMTWPKRYGGHERSALERYVVLEEVLAAGAPVAAHWIADRQSGPLLLRFGTEEQRRSVLPGIAAGECFACIGMSEPDSGSDLAATRTRADPVPGGFRINGTKLWTTYAHKSQVMVVFCRTGAAEDRHGGTSQFLVDLTRTEGITVRPILDLQSTHHFNEVVFQDAFVPESALIGALGDGWKQVTSELAYERSGPERFLTSMTLVRELIGVLGPDAGEAAEIAIGRLTAQLLVLRRLSRGVAWLLQNGSDPALQAAIVKDLGAVFEQGVPDIARDLVAADPHAPSTRRFCEVLDLTVMSVPSYSLRGGTREILRGIIARGLGLR